MKKYIVRGMIVKMKFEFDDFNFKDQVEFINLNKQMQQNQIEFNQNIGFNNDILYDFAEKKDNKI